jgi:hypothetical protein
MESKSSSTNNLVGMICFLSFFGLFIVAARSASSNRDQIVGIVGAQYTRLLFIIMLTYWRADAIRPNFSAYRPFVPRAYGMFENMPIKWQTSSR